MAIGDPFEISQHGQIIINEDLDTTLIANGGYLSFLVEAPAIIDHTERGLNLLIEQFRKTYPQGDKGINE